MSGTSETCIWAIGVQGDRSTNELRSATDQLCSVYPFQVPNNLKVGTLDSLMSLSDDLSKLDLLAEGTITKMYKQLSELKPDDEPTINGGAPHTRTQSETRRCAEHAERSSRPPRARA